MLRQNSSQENWKHRQTFIFKNFHLNTVYKSRNLEGLLMSMPKKWLKNYGT